MVLNERYRLDERIATGGMGDVWRATDLVLGRQVAVKILLPALLTDPDFLTRFRAEARMMAAVRHPGIVQVYDTGEDAVAGGGRAVYLVMEYVDGKPLSSRINATGRLAAAETMSIVAQVAEALHAAHERGIVHRDVKPSNVLVQPDGTVVLVDFGVARSTAVTSITSPNAVPGTALYMAPEQAAGRPVSAATDVYALGVVAYHCVAGHTPFSGENALEVAVKHLNDELPPLPADVPRPVAEVIERALAKDAADRFPSARDFAAAARAVAADPTAPVPPAADSGPVATPTAPVDAGAAAAEGAEAKMERPGPRTLPDLPVVPPAESASADYRWRAPLLGVAAAVLIAALGATAFLTLRPDDDMPATDATAPATPSVMPSLPPTPQQAASTPPEPNETRYRPVRPTLSHTPEPSTEPSDPGQEPEPSTEPTSPPSSQPSPEPSPNPPTPTAEATSIGD